MHEGIKIRETPESLQKLTFLCKVLHTILKSSIPFSYCGKEKNLSVWQIDTEFHIYPDAQFLLGQSYLMLLLKLLRKPLLSANSPPRNTFSQELILAGYEVWLQLVFLRSIFDSYCPFKD